MDLLYNFLKPKTLVGVDFKV